MAELLDKQMGKIIMKQLLEGLAKIEPKPTPGELQGLVLPIYTLQESVVAAENE